MLLTVHVKPNARQSHVRAWIDRATLRVDIAAPATDGKANKELIRFLAGYFGIAPSLVEIVRGQGSRVKHVRLPDGAVDQPNLV